MSHVLHYNTNVTAVALPRLQDFTHHKNLLGVCHVRPTYGTPKSRKYAELSWATTIGQRPKTIHNTRSAPHT